MAAEGSRYELLGELGRGGMGVVHRARDTRLDRVVALKLCTFDDERGEARARFQREVETCAQLAHPSIVRIFDHGTLDGRPFYTMELLEAHDLEHLQRTESPLAVERAVSLLAQASDALAFLHARGIVHRDVKPSNLMVDAAGTLKVTDFGLVRVRDRTAITEDGETLGTLRYLAPEALDPGYVTAPPQDVYALGLVIWELVAGRRAFCEDSMMGLLCNIVQLEPAPLGEVRPDTPGWLSALVARCVAKDPAVRPGAAEIRDACRTPPPSRSGARRATGRPSRVRAGAPSHPPVDASPPRARTPGALAALAACAALAAWLALRAPPPVPSVRSSPATSASAASATITASAPVPAIANLYWLETDRSALADFDVPAPAPLAVEIASQDGTMVVTSVPVPTGVTAFHRWLGGLAPSRRYLLRIRDVSRDAVVARIPIETRDAGFSGRVRRGLASLTSGGAVSELGLEVLREDPDPQIVRPLIDYGSRYTGVGLTNRLRMAELLAALREPAGADMLAAFIERGEDPDVSMVSLRALAACRSARAVPAARKLLAKYNAPVHHDRIFRALSVRANDAAFDLLCEHMDRAELGEGSALGASLARTSPARARSFLARRARGSPPRVVGLHDLHAACALGDAEMIRLVTPLLDAPGARVRADAVFALTGLGHPVADAALDAALSREPLALDLLIAAGRRRLPGAGRAVLAALGKEHRAPVRAAALAAAALLATGRPRPATVLERVLALASDRTALLHETAVVTLARWIAAGGQPAIPLPAQAEDRGRFALARAQAGSADATAEAAAKLRRADTSPDGLERRGRLVLALALAKNPAAGPLAKELEKSPGAFARWAGFEAGRVARAPESERAYLIDPREMIHATGLRLEAGDVVWLRVAGAFRWGDAVGMQPVGFNFRDTIPVWLAPCALVGGAALALTSSWTPHRIERSGELEVWMHGAPHYHTPGRDPALLPSLAEGLIAVWVRR